MPRPCKYIIDGKERSYEEFRALIAQGAFGDIAPPAEPPKEGKPEERGPREVKKTIVNRAYEGEFREEVKKGLELMGLYRETETEEQARASANDIIEKYGLPAALDAVRAGDVPGGAAVFIYGTAIKDAQNRWAEAKTKEEVDNALVEQVMLASELDRIATSKGRFIHSLAALYDDGLGFAQKNIKSWKERFGEDPPKEIMEKLAQREKEVEALKEKIKEAEKRAEQAEAQASVDAIKESVLREQKRKREASERKKEAKALADRIRGLKIKTGGAAGAFIIPPQVFNSAIEAVALAVQAGETIAKAVAKGVEALRNSDWYKGLSRSEQQQAEADLSNQVNEVSEAQVVNGRIKVSKQAIRDAVEAGATDIETLTKVIRDQIKEEYPEVTHREVRDAITDYGKVVNQNKDEIDAEIRKMRRVGRLISALEDVANKKRPLRSGLQRDKLDAQERLLAKQLKDAMRDLPMDEQTAQREMATALDAAKNRARNRIEELQLEIESGERTLRGKKHVIPDDELKSLNEEKQRLQEEHDKVFGDKSLTMEERLKAAEDSVRRSIENLEERIKDRRLEDEKKGVVDSPLLTELRKKRDDLRAELKAMQDEAGITDRKRLEAAKRAVNKRIGGLLDRLKNKDFSKKEKRQTIADDELTALRAQKLRIQEWYDKALHEHALENRTWPEKAKDFAWQAWGLTRALQATGELSFVLMQGGKLTISNLWHNPRAVAGAFKNMLKAMSSESHTDEWLSKIRSQDWYPQAKEAGLAIMEPHGEMTAREELFFSDWTRVIWNAAGSPLRLAGKKAYDRWVLFNPFRAVERGAVGYLDTLRVERFLDGMAILEAKKKAGEEVTKKDYKDVADVANTLTGRAKLGPLEQVSSALTKVFFSPRLWASAIKTSTPYSLIWLGRMSPTARKMALQDLGRYVGTTASIVAMAALWADNDDDDETSVETDPRSGDFGKIRIGDTRIDPWGGNIQQIVLTSRIVAGALGMDAYKNAKGDVLPLGVPYRSPTMSDLGAQMATNKLAPTASMLYGFASSELRWDKERKEYVRQDRFGNEYSVADEVTERLYPIYFGTVNDLMKEDPGALEGFLLVYSFFGGGVQEYERKEKKKKKRKGPPGPPRMPSPGSP